MGQAILDKNKPEATLTCASCHKPLWHMKILGKFSRSFVPVGPGIPQFGRIEMKYIKESKCPLCQQPFARVDRRGNPQFQMRDKHGTPFIL